MDAMAIFSLAKELFRHSLLSRRSSALVRVISWLCILGVGIGVASLVVVLSVMNGFDDAIRGRLISVQPHLIIQANPEIDADKVDGILRTSPGAKISPFEQQDVIIRTAEGLFSGGQARGLNLDTMENMVRQSRRLRNAENRSNFQVPENVTLELGPNEVLIGVDLARSLEIFEGDEIVAISPESLLLPSGMLPTYEKVKVRGLVRTNVPEIDNAAIMYEIGNSMKRLKKDSGRETGFEIQLKNPYEFSGLKSEFEIAGFKTESWEDRNKALFYSLKMEKVAMGLFLGLSVLIASFSILTVLVLLVTHKRSEIGVLMAMGLSRRRARMILTSVGLALSSFGVLGGLLFGLLLCWIIDTFPIIKLPDIYYDTRIPVLVDPRVVLALLGASGVISLISSWLPARFITRGTPSSLLRPLVTNQE